MNAAAHCPSCGGDATVAGPETFACAACGRRWRASAADIAAARAAGPAPSAPGGGPFEHAARSAEPGGAPPPAPAAAPGVCPSCGAALAAGTAFCPSCGLEVAKGFGITRAEAGPAEACRACGHPLAPRETRCGFCGTARAAHI
uniref:Zinc-ribbon domain-containing protein n=1 Tax=Eiseniibacteriota bacterium TaxID=2212470 RepID=A0A832MKK7_UNCEI